MGAFAGLLLASATVTALSGRAGADDQDSSAGTTAALVHLALGGIFFILAAKQWKSRPVPGGALESPRWMASLETSPPLHAFLLGALIMTVNPKNLSILTATSISIAEAGLTTAGTIGILLIFCLLGILGFIIPIAIAFLAGERGEAWLGTIISFLNEHSSAIMFVLFVVLGSKMLGSGIADLT